MKIPDELIPLLVFRKSLIEKLQKGGDSRQLLNEISLAGVRIVDLLQAAYNHQQPKG